MGEPPQAIRRSRESNERDCARGSDLHALLQFSGERRILRNAILCGFMKMRVSQSLLALTLVACVTASSAFAQPALDFGALTLPAAETLLATRSRDIALSRRQVEQAQADVLTAGQKPNPQFNWLTQNINRNRGVGAGTLRDKTVDTIVGISQTFERGDKPALRVATARQLEAAAGLDLNDTARTQLLTLRGAYFDLMAAQEKLASVEEAAQLYGKTIAAANLRLKAGDLAAADVARISADALRAQNDARAAEAEVSRGRLVVAYLIAAEADAARIRAVSPWTQANAATSADQIDEMVLRRPDVRAAQTRVAAADRARELAQALRTRDVTLGVQFEHYPVNDNNQSGSGNSIGVGVSVPLFLRHNYEGEIARAQADWYVARDFLERVKAQALGETLKARSDLEAARDRLLRYDGELLPQARKSAAAAEFAFRNGATGVMDLLDSRRILQAIQIDAVAARADYAKARAVWQSNLEVVSLANGRTPAGGDGKGTDDKR